MSELSRNGLTALTWVFTGAGIVLTAGRYAIRLKTVKSLKMDDYIHGAALVILVGYVSTYTVMFPLNYSVEFWVAGLGKGPSVTDLKRYFRLEIAVSLLFWIIIYLVKFSFLAFYHLLFSVSRKFMRAWWPVCAFTVVTFLINFISVFWACEAPRQLFALVIILPLWMIRGLQISTSRKVGLAGLFLIAIIDVIFDITRTIYTVDGGAVALDTIWDILEPTIAVIVSSLPTYKALFGTTRKKQDSVYDALGHRPNGNGNTRDTHDKDQSRGIRLSTVSTQGPKEVRTDQSVNRSTDVADTVALV
ncbi:MAG: hypothetical protein Q9213_002180 [Squamulea squamosa]